MYNEINFQDIFEKKKPYISDKMKKYVSFLAEYSKIDSEFEITKKCMQRYKAWLLGLRNERGHYLLPSGIYHNLEYIRAFLNILLNEKLIEHNPLSPFLKAKELKELKNDYTQRRETFFKEKYMTLTDEELLSKYLEHAEKYYKPDFMDDLQKGVQTLKEYSIKSNKRICGFNYKDIETILDELIILQMYPSIKIAAHTLRQKCYALRAVLQWMYEEGYKEDDILKDWKESVILQIIANKNSRLKSLTKPKNRRYTTKEILITYQKYLKETYENYDDFKSLFNNFKLFIPFAESRKENLYTVNKETIETFKTYLLNYEYSPGKFYTPFYQSDRIRAVKRFYDWFTINRYSTEHPLEDFKFSQYQTTITEACKLRQSTVPSIETVPECFKNEYERICEHEKTLGLSKGTFHMHDIGWRFFFYYLANQEIKDIKDVDEQILELYQVHLHKSKNKKGEPLSVHTVMRHLIAVKRLFSYLSKYRYILRDPSICINLPKIEKGLPTAGMSDREVKLILKDEFGEKALRDRALLETLYSTGIRANEARNLQVEDIDFVKGFVRINVPKGGIKYQRVIPIGRTACSWIKKYINDVRCRIKDLNTKYLFVSFKGKQMSTGLILNIVKTKLIKSGIRKNVVTHSFRVSCATEMLKGDADIKYVQQQLGHVSINSTERYLRLVPNDLKIVHSKTHPSERRKEII